MTYSDGSTTTIPAVVNPAASGSDSAKLPVGSAFVGSSTNKTVRERLTVWPDPDANHVGDSGGDLVHVEDCLRLGWQM